MVDSAAINELAFLQNMEQFERQEHEEQQDVPRVNVVSSLGQSGSSTAVDTGADHMTQTMQAWDQIGELTSELGVSMIARQASQICDRFVREGAPPIHKNSMRPSKRVKLQHNHSHHGPIVPFHQDGEEQAPMTPVVSSDESSESTGRSESQHSASPSNQARRPIISDTLSREIDRMSRMSRLMMILEQTRSTLREEMLSMMEDEAEDAAEQNDRDDSESER